jgi:hypothetical protein
MTRNDDLSTREPVSFAPETVSEQPVSDGADVAHGETAVTNVTVTNDADQPFLLTWGALKDIQYPPTVWLVEGLLAEGFYTFSGKPKEGKSKLALSMCVAVAGGVPLFGNLNADQSGTLYVTYEDEIELVQERLHRMVPEGVDCSQTLAVKDDLPPLDEGGLDLLDRFFSGKPPIKLVVIDTLMQGLSKHHRSSTYHRDLEIINRLREFALRHHIVVIAVHHSTKGKFADPADSVRGTLGLTGSATGYMVLESTKDEHVFRFKARGKRVRYEVSLCLDDDTGAWTVVPDQEQAAAGSKRRAILDVLAAADHDLTIEEIQQGLLQRGEEPAYAPLKKMLAEMVKAGEIERASRGLYRATATEKPPATNIVRFPGAGD